MSKSAVVVQIVQLLQTTCMQMAGREITVTFQRLEGESVCALGIVQIWVTLDTGGHTAPDPTATLGLCNVYLSKRAVWRACVLGVCIISVKPISSFFPAQNEMWIAERRVN